jgi:hypothetical protein
MGHCSRAFNDRPDYATGSRALPNIGWTVIDPYRADFDPYRSARRPADPDVSSWARSGMRPAARPPYVPVAPIIVITIVLLSTASAGLVFLPFLVFGLVMVTAANQGARRRRSQHQGHRPSAAGPAMRPDPPAAPAPQQQPTTEATEEWPTRNPAVRSPFESVAFWDEELSPPGAGSPAPLTPPAWDPLGVAPFAWDLPEPPPLPPVRRPRRPHVGAAKTITVAALMAALLVTAGDFAGWWPLDWAAAAVSAVAVLAIATIGGSAKQRVRR